jgi:hypothetical protein
VIGAAPLKWKICSPGYPNTASSFPDVDILILVMVAMSGIGMLSHELLEAMSPEMRVEYRRWCEQ